MALPRRYEASSEDSSPVRISVLIGRGTVATTHPMHIAGHSAQPHLLIRSMVSASHVLARLPTSSNRHRDLRFETSAQARISHAFFYRLGVASSLDFVSIHRDMARDEFVKQKKNLPARGIG